MHFKSYPVELGTVKVLNYDCMHSGQHIKEIDKTLAVLFIPAIDMITAFWCFIVLQFDEK